MLHCRLQKEARGLERCRLYEEVFWEMIRHDLSFQTVGLPFVYRAVIGIAAVLGNS